MTSPEPRGSLKQPQRFDRQRLAQYFFFGVFLLLLYQTALMLSPFFVAILGAAILAMIGDPIMEWLAGKMPRYRKFAAGLTTTLMLLTIVIPFIVFGWMFIKDAPNVYPAAKGWIAGLAQLKDNPNALPIPDSLRTLWDKTDGFLQVWNIDLQDIFLKNLDEMSANMSHLASILIRNVLFVVINLLVLTFTLFFFLKDGSNILRNILALVPMPQDYKREILDRMQETLFAVLRGVLVIAALEGLLTGVGLALCRVPFPVLLGTLAMVLSPVPIIGPAGVWLPVAICLALSGHIMQGVYVSLWCLLVVHSMESVLRPVLIGSHANIPVLLLFFGLLGGMRVYGFIGLLLGPVLIALVLAFVRIYQQEYRGLLQKTTRDAPAP